MSHKSTVSTKINNIDSLKKALDRLNIKYTEGSAKTKGNYGVHEDVDLIINQYGSNSVNDAVGFKKQKDGTYQATGDFYGMRDDKGRSIDPNTFKNRVENAYNFEEINNRYGQVGFNCVNQDIDFSNREVSYVLQRMVP